jgi:hypothetical protein
MAPRIWIATGRRIPMPLLTAQPGQKLAETLEVDDRGTVYSATHEVGDDLRLRTIEEHWADQALREIGVAPLREPPALRGAETGIAVAKLAWDIIKEGKVAAKTTDAMSSVLSQADRDPLHYEAARAGVSGAYTWTVCDSLIKSLKYVEIKLRVEGSYAARPVKGSPAPGGLYLPDVYVNILTCNVNFPCSASGSANISNIVNVGHGEVDPALRVHAKLTAGWFAQHMGITVGFTAQGSRGFGLLGKEG